MISVPEEEPAQGTKLWILFKLTQTSCRLSRTEKVPAAAATTHLQSFMPTAWRRVTVMAAFLRSMTRSAETYLSVAEV